MDDQQQQQQQQSNVVSISQITNPTVPPGVSSPRSMSTTGSTSLSSSTPSLTTSTGALGATIKGAEQTKNWKFKPQTPTDILSNGYRRRRRNSAPAPSVEAFVTHWKYDTKGGSMVDLKNNPGTTPSTPRTPSKLQHNFTKPSSPEPQSPISPQSPRSPPHQGSGGAVYCNSRAAVRKNPYDRRRSLPFIHDPNAVSINQQPYPVNTEYPSLAPLSLITPSVVSPTSISQQTATIPMYSMPPPFVPHQPHPAFTPAQLPHQITLQEQILLNQQLPHQVQYPLQPLPIKVDSTTTPLPPLSSLLHSLKINDESLKNAPFQHTESAFQPTKPSLTNSNDTNYNQPHSDEVSSSQMLIENLISEPNAENRKMAISNLVQ